MSDPTAPAAGCPRWMKFALGASLALNLVIIGVFAGLVLRGGPPREGAARMGYAAPYVVALPRNLRREVFSAIRSDASLPGRTVRRARYNDMIEVLRDDPFDPGRAQAILARQGGDVARIQDVSRAAWLSVVADMDLAERLAYVDRIEEVLRRGKRNQAGDRK